MPNELQSQYATANTLYAVILNPAGQAWNTNTSAFENLNGSNWSNYAVALTEQVSAGVYFGNFPTAIVTAGVYNVMLRLRSGGTPAITDVSIGSARIQWSGSAEIPPGAAGSTTLTYGSFK